VRVISSDFCRGLVSDDENDQASTADAFAGAPLHREPAIGITAVHGDRRNERPARGPQAARRARQTARPVPGCDRSRPARSICQERNRLRPDRQVGAHVVRRQRNDRRRSLKGLQREGFRSVWVLRAPEDVTPVEVSRAPLWTDRRIEHGPFDIVGDIHGCHAELTELLRDLGYTVAAGCASDPSLCGSSGLGSRHSTGSCAASRSTGSTNVSSGCSRWRASRSTRGCEPHLFGPRRKGTASGCRCFHALARTPSLG
jgi:protein phosphatase